MVIDTSAIIAILFDEPDHRRYAEAIAAAPVRLVSAVTHVELSFVAEGRKGEAGRVRLNRFLALTGAEIVSITPRHAEIASDAFRRFGKGRHAPALNIGDCFSYALATATNHPLLFKGNDFNQTDIRPVLTVVDVTPPAG
ncbi:MAG: ribonuclease VapC [Acetobacteraceae bacterium]|nr:ribonuclease VapC [Acetobacteraceae bacterium]